MYRIGESQDNPAHMEQMNSIGLLYETSQFIETRTRSIPERGFVFSEEATDKSDFG